ncbi:hypothetical protein DMB91_01345 [Campylobacter sp. MIT 97-5078]|uniref:hypothetical protein n=1 Tax=Campylobacter sp. MIT 97-5078 TaxID=1548153 RepID=UPI001160D1FC|nr:hypothetical protein [Campylobacter sp. MIT 97-5078]TQR27912.1 hypothetical protein DMB91_01345 [Campylobacter sp. MIT 97-5078]
MITFNNTQFINIDELRSSIVYTALKGNISRNTYQTPIKVSNDSSSSPNLTNQISFTDKISGQNITLKISDENLNKLQSKFSSNDFSKDENGHLVLKGEAGDFVSGWFGDIAYQRGYLKADYNQDGFLNENERKETLSNYGSDVRYCIRKKDSNVVKITAKGVYSYEKGSTTKSNNSIENELNNTIQKDANMDGVLKLSELESIGQTISDIKKVVEKKEDTNPLAKTPSALDLPSPEELIEYLKKEKENQDKAEQILENNELEKALQQDYLAVNTVDISKLSKNQKEALKSQELRQNDDMLDLASSIKDNIKTNLSIDKRV